MGFELVVELLIGQSHRFAFNYVFEGIYQFVGDLTVVQSRCKEDHLDGRFVKVLESVLT